LTFLPITLLLSCLVARRNKGRGGEERQKDTKRTIGRKQNDIHNYRLLLRLRLVNHNREMKQDRTKKEVERKNRREKG
jgi:hypothetical protein